MDKHRFNLILPLELWERLKALALRRRRPVTQEIIIAIEDHLDDAQNNRDLDVLERRIDAGTEQLKDHDEVWKDHDDSPA